MDYSLPGFLRLLVFTGVCFLVACGGGTGGRVACTSIPSQTAGLMRATMSVRTQLAAGYVTPLCSSAPGTHHCHGYRVTPSGLSALGYARRTSERSLLSGACGSGALPATQPEATLQPVAQASQAACVYGSTSLVAVTAAGACPTSAATSGAAPAATPAPSSSCAASGSTSGTALPAGYRPVDLQAAYGLTCISPGGGQGRTVAVVIDGNDTQLESNLGVYRSQFGLSPCTVAGGCLKIVGQNGTTSNLPLQASDVAEEELDVEMISAICPNCNILVVESNSLNAPDANKAEDTAASFNPVAINNSWGGPPEDPNSAQHFNHPGIAIVVADGDCGYLDYLNAGDGCRQSGAGLEYPSDFNTVIAVGGTVLTRNSASARGWAETAWPDTGGGCSQVIGKPSWQKDPGCPRRMVGDVAFVSDCSTGVAVFQQGSWGVDCGTSVASPAVAAIYALTSDNVRNASTLYANPGAMNDIIAGSNGTCSPDYFCTAGVGYDGPTGMGTPNGLGAF